ncbi:MAG: Panacea domain-containing protein [Bryobacteraceae bacterium]|jgi:uncharacterized phage-associated protein
MLSFDFRADKFASAVAFLVERRPGLTKKQICKLMYYADKTHLLRYGRPITGDTYYALEQGPIPTRGLNAMNEAGRVPADDEALRAYGKLEGWEFRIYRGADLKAFSRTDIAVLEEIDRKFGGCPAWRLERMTHREPAWKKAPQNGPMKFEDFFESEPSADLVKSILIEDQDTGTAEPVEA